MNDLWRNLRATPVVAPGNVALLELLQSVIERETEAALNVGTQALPPDLLTVEQSKIATQEVQSTRSASEF